jgi:hypothetical protein
MHFESLESRALLSAGGHTVTVPLHSSAEGNLAGNFVTGHSTLLGRFTGAFNAAGQVVFTAANGDQLIAEPTLTPTSDPAVVHAEGSFVGGTGRFTGATGTFSVDLVFINDQGDFVYQHVDPITLQRPWNGRNV